jgi:urease accessory protein
MSVGDGRSLRGHLFAVASTDENGETYLRTQSFRAPLHLSKPHHEAGALVVNIVSPTAGLFDGDEVDVTVQVETGARLVLTTPSACRIHRARGETPAVMRQEMKVRTGGFLEFIPELIIPHRGARYRQTTSLHVEAGATLLFFEWLSPGRVASGETFAYAELQWETDLWHGETLIACERFSLKPDGPHLASLRAIHEASHYLGCFLVGGLVFPHEEIDALGSADVLVGGGPLTEGGWTVKALCRDNLTTRRTLEALRTIIYRALARPMPALRRF